LGMSEDAQNSQRIKFGHSKILRINYLCIVNAFVRT
jgi:hypothetical protein